MSGLYDDLSNEQLDENSGGIEDLWKNAMFYGGGGGGGKGMKKAPAWNSGAASGGRGGSGGGMSTGGRLANPAMPQGGADTSGADPWMSSAGDASMSADTTMPPADAASFDTSLAGDPAQADPWLGAVDPTANAQNLSSNDGNQYGQPPPTRAVDGQEKPAGVGTIGKGLDYRDTDSWKKYQAMIAKRDAKMKEAQGLLGTGGDWYAARQIDAVAQQYKADAIQEASAHNAPLIQAQSYAQRMAEIDEKNQGHITAARQAKLAGRYQGMVDGKPAWMEPGEPGQPDRPITTPTPGKTFTGPYADPKQAVPDWQSIVAPVPQKEPANPIHVYQTDDGHTYAAERGPDGKPTSVPLQGGGKAFAPRDDKSAAQAAKSDLDVTKTIKGWEKDIFDSSPMAKWEKDPLKRSKIVAPEMLKRVDGLPDTDALKQKVVAMYGGGGGAAAPAAAGGKKIAPKGTEVNRNGKVYVSNGDKTWTVKPAKGQ